MLSKRMSRVRRRLLQHLLCFMPLAVMFSSCTERFFPVPPTSTLVQVNVDRTAPEGISRFSPGISHIDDMLDTPPGDMGAVNRVKSLIKGAIPYSNTHIMAWGAPDPWSDPNEPEPDNWAYLDKRLQMMLEISTIPVITLCEAPWWMKGKLQSDGSTQLLQASEEWDDIAYESRVLDNKMDKWLLLVQRVAERYMLPPYNVRYFQVWNEMKGYYNPATDTYDFSLNAGDPHGSNAKHGYTYMYNLVYERLIQVARSLGIPTEEVKVGGPYAVIDTWAMKNQGKLSKFMTPYGIYDQRPLDILLYWLKYKAGAGFITIDGINRNRDQDFIDPFTAAEKFADMTKWIRSLDNQSYPGVAMLPIWWGEWYVKAYAQQADDQVNNAVKTHALIKFVKAGGAVTLSWGGIGEDTTDSGIWTKTSDTNGGQPRPWYYSYKAFGDHFSPGTQLYKTTVSSPSLVEVLASSTDLMLVNKSAQPLLIKSNGQNFELAPYGVRVLKFVA